MPSIGLALHAGRQMWESERKEKETNDRFLAERKLFDAQLKEQEAAAEYLNQANEQARSAKKSILNNRERILIGDPTGTANVLRDTVYRDFDGKVTVDPTTKEVIIIDKDGKEVGRQQPLMGMDGVAKLMQLGNTIDQTYAANVAAQQLAQQRAYEMTKMREEKGFDYRRLLMLQASVLTHSLVLPLWELMLLLELLVLKLVLIGTRLNLKLILVYVLLRWRTLRSLIDLSGLKL